jgi:hypothetical protein
MKKKGENRSARFLPLDDAFHGHTLEANLAESILDFCIQIWLLIPGDSLSTVLTCVIEA